MPLNQGYLHNKSESFTELAAELDLATLEELRKVTNRLTEDPDLEFEDRIRDFAEDETESWYEDTQTWINANLSLVYLRAINIQDRELAEMVSVPKFEDNPIPLARFSERARITGEISDKAKEVLSNYPKHWDSYKRYEATFKEGMNKIRLPFRNSTVQNYRDIAALRMQPAFQEGSVATRRDLAQDVLNEFSDRGIGVVDFDNRKMSVEAFANREARAYMQDVAVQGQINRATQRGYDLVRINSYAGPSPMCAPHQGNVYSLSGDSEQYPPLSNAIHDGSYSYGSGIYHDYSYSLDTKVYTNEGWKFIDECHGYEKVLSLNPSSHETEWANIARQTRYQSEGMVEFMGDAELMVTPDHDMYIECEHRFYARVRADNLIGHEFKHLSGRDNLTPITLEASYRDQKQMVCCLTLDRNHLMLVKREKIPVWSTNCGHFQSSYIPGVSEQIQITDDPAEQQILNEMGESEGNRWIYKQRQVQQKIEYRIRSYKRKQAASLTKAERVRNQKLVRKWQGRMREHVDQHDFLRRSYSDESLL